MTTPRRPVNALRTIYRGRIFRVEREHVTLPHGVALTMDVIRHRGSVVLLPQPEAGQIVLIRQYRHVIRRSIWELPAGTLEPGEQPARAARRECEEETGWRPRRVVRLGEYYATPGYCDERMIFYACLGLARPSRPARGDDDEHILPQVFTLRQAWALVRRGEVVDMKTVLGLAIISGRVPAAARP
jgi:ADP-ribose pyrophosphatase